MCQAQSSVHVSPAEKNYSTIEKEFLALVYGLEKYHYYTFGRSVRLQTDHRPLVHLVAQHVDKLTPRLQRFLLRFLRYSDATVEYLPGAKNFLPDLLSRYTAERPSPVTTKFTDELCVAAREMVDVHDLGVEYILHCHSRILASPYVQTCIRYCEADWPEKASLCTDGTDDIWHLRDRVVYSGPCPTFENCLIIPPELRRDVLTELHTGHVRADTMLRRAKSSFFWTRLAAAVQDFAAKCQACQIAAPKPSRVEQRGIVPAFHPGSHVAMDFYTLKSQKGLVLVDAFSKYVEFFKTNGEKVNQGDAVAPIFFPGDKALLFRASTNKWEPVRVLRTGVQRNSYVVRLQSGAESLRNVHQLRLHMTDTLDSIFRQTQMLTTTPLVRQVLELPHSTPLTSKPTSLPLTPHRFSPRKTTPLRCPIHLLVGLDPVATSSRVNASARLLQVQRQQRRNLLDVMDSTIFAFLPSLFALPAAEVLSNIPVVSALISPPVPSPNPVDNSPAVLSPVCLVPHPQDQACLPVTPTRVVARLQTSPLVTPMSCHQPVKDILTGSTLTTGPLDPHVITALTTAIGRMSLTPVSLPPVTEPTSHTTTHPGIVHPLPPPPTAHTAPFTVLPSGARPRTHVPNRLAATHRDTTHNQGGMMPKIPPLRIQIGHSHHGRKQTMTQKSIESGIATALRSHRVLPSSITLCPPAQAGMAPSDDHEDNNDPDCNAP